MTAIASILLLTWAINALCNALSEYAEEVSEYMERNKRIKRLERTAQTVRFMRDNTNDETVREYYTERAAELTARLKEERRNEC